MEKREGRVNDLVEKLVREEITPEEAKKELKQRGLGHFSLMHILSSILIFAMLLPMYISTVAKISNWDVLTFFTQLPTIDFPLVVKLLAAILLAFGLYMMFSASRLLSSKGGLKEGDESIIFIREGPYKIMRHPIAFGIIFGFIVLPPIILSGWISYTPLTAISQILVIVFMLIVPLDEEKTNIRKWGEVYRQYMKEVPRFNFILGIWRWLKRKSR